MPNVPLKQRLRQQAVALRREQRLLISDLRPVTGRPIVPVRLPLLLITQIQRSGGTLLSQLLDGHHQVHTHPHELYFGRPRKWDWPDIGVTGRSPRQVFAELYERPTDRFIVDGYAKRSRGGAGSTGEARHPFRFSRRHQRHVFVKCWREWGPTSQRDILDAYFTSYFNAWLDYSIDPNNACFVAGFVPRLNMVPDSVARYARDYPDGRVVTIVRDPCAWYASASRHDHKYVVLDEAIRLWLESTRASLTLARERPDQVRLILFEDLVLRTFEVMRSVLDWLGLEWNDTAVEPTFKRQPIAADSSFTVNGFGVQSDSVTRRTVLPQEVQDTIRERTAALYTAALEAAGR